MNKYFFIFALICSQLTLATEEERMLVVKAIEAYPEAQELVNLPENRSRYDWLLSHVKWFSKKNKLNAKKKKEWDETLEKFTNKTEMVMDDEDSRMLGVEHPHEAYTKAYTFVKDTFDDVLSSYLTWGYKLGRALTIYK
jgi:hypothetical protein